MATNSHLVIEVKGLAWNPEGWSIWAEDVAESGWYRMYDAMAGARGTTGIEPAVAPRGIPEDADGCTKMFFERLGGHTESWLAPHEYAEAFARASQGHDPVPWNDPWRILGSVLFCLKTSFSNDGARLVMAFDN